MGKRILLVDDEPLILKGLKYTLEQEGYETDSAMDGEEAVAKFFAQPYDMILLDVMLPKLDGISVCQRSREHSNVPIIMITAKAAPSCSSPTIRWWPSGPSGRSPSPPGASSAILPKKFLFSPNFLQKLLQNDCKTS